MILLATIIKKQYLVQTSNMLNCFIKFKEASDVIVCKRKRTHTHTHTYIYISIYIHVT